MGANVVFHGRISTHGVFITVEVLKEGRAVVRESDIGTQAVTFAMFVEPEDDIEAVAWVEPIKAVVRTMLACGREEARARRGAPKAETAGREGL